MPSHRYALAFAALLSIAACSGADNVTQPVVAPVERLIVASSNVSLTAGQRETITARLVGAADTTLANVPFSFTSGNPSIAMVSPVGVVTGLSAGTASITINAAWNGVIRTTVVTVTVTGSLPTALTVISGAASNDFIANYAVVARGATVTWMFTGRTHNVFFQDGQAGAPANIPNTANLATGIPRTFTAPGTYEYTCTRHAGMNGTIVVP